MTSAAPVPDATPRGRAARLVATAFGLGTVPRLPGTAGSLGAVAVFAALYTALHPSLFPLVYLILLAVIGIAAFWSTARALPEWSSHDPQAIVIDEVLGQWLTYGALLVAAALGGPASARWKTLAAGFILFRFFDVVKPFPIRRCERVPGATGIVLDDVVAGVYAALALLGLLWTGWLP
jgi:phosphatidylglycerophosphatase A